MNKVADAFRKAERTTPGWNKAKEIVVALNSVADPSSLEWEQKIHLITLAMQAATQSEYWVEFLIAVSDVLTCPHGMKMNKNQSRAKKPTKKRPDFIYSGDTCFFKKPTAVYPAEKDWSYTTEIMRVIWPGDSITYLKRMRKGRGGPWLHCFESYGLQYIYEGSIKDFTKEKKGWPDDE